MSWRDEPRDGKRVAYWIILIVAPVLEALMLASPGPRFWWDYVSLVFYPVVGLEAAHQLFAKRKADA